MSLFDGIIDGVKRAVTLVLMKTEVIALLRSPVVAKVEFEYDTFRIKGDDFRMLADDIALGKVGVVTDTLSPGAGAEYQQLPTDPNPNSLVFPTTWTRIGTDVNRRMSVIHEAVHAIQDKAARNLNHVAAEAPAFVAEALFVLLDGATHSIFDPIKKARTYDETRVVYRRAWLAAEELAGPPKRKAVPAWRVKHINEAVHAHSLYDRRHTYRFDGI